MKIIYALLLLVFASFSVHSQIVITEGFEGTFPPTGWTLALGTPGSTHNWSYNTDPTFTDGPYDAHGGAGSMVYEYDVNAAANAWAFTPSAALTAGTSYSVSFWYRIRSATYPEKMKVTVGNAATIAAQTTTLWNNAGGTELTNVAWTQGVIQFTPTTTGTYYFGFNCYSDADKWAMQVDDVVVEVTPGAVPTCTNNITPVNNAVNVATDSIFFSWNSVAGATSYNIYIGTTNPPTTLLLNIPDTSIVLTGGVPGTTYYWYIAPQNAAGAAAGCSTTTTSFTTVAPPANDSACNAIPLVLNGPSHCANTANATATEDSAITCSTPNNTLWYSYTPAVSGPVGIKMKRPAGAIAPLNGWVVLLSASGTCPSLLMSQEFECGAADLVANDSVTIYPGYLTAGTKYYIMIDGFAGAVGEYCISLLQPPAPPACTNLLQPANGAVDVDAPVAAFNWNAAPGATGYAFWIGITAATLDSIGVTPDTLVNFTGLAYNTTYYWMIVPENGGGSAAGCIIDSFTTKAQPPLPTNDSCGAPVALQTNIPVNGYTIGATQSLAGEACNGFTGTADDDVWYSFTPGIGGDITLTLTPQFSLDAVIIAYTGLCGALTTIGCADSTFGGEAEVLNLTGLVAGTTYYFRVYSFAGAGGEGSFSLLITGTAMPVSLVSFKGETDGSVNVLSWSTSTEQNAEGFELQRSADGRNFSSLSFIKSKGLNGNSSAPLNYAFNDNKPFAGSSYYRLKQMDKDGKFKLSDVVIVKGGRTNSIVMSAVYPNPAKTQVNVLLTAPSAERISLVVTDLAGKVVLSKAVQLVAGDNNFALQIDNLPSGSYLVKAVCGNGCEAAVNKLVKQ